MKTGVFFLHFFLRSIYFATLASPALVAAAADDAAIDIPKVAAAPLTDTGWLPKAFHAEVLKPTGNRQGAHAALALAWNEKGLLVHVGTSDATPFESQENSELWTGDALDVFTGSATDERDGFQVLFAPGRTAEQKEPRFFVVDKRAKKPALAAPEICIHEKSAGGYAMSALIPWSNFTKPPSPGELVRLRIFVVDGIVSGMTPRRVWFPLDHAFDDRARAYKVRLSPDAAAPEKAVAFTQLDRQWKAQLHVSAVAELAGKDVVIDFDGSKIPAGVLAKGGPDGSELTFPLPTDIATKKDAKIQVLLDGEEISHGLAVPDPVEARRKLVSFNWVAAQPSVFSGKAFPAIDFSNRELADIALGPYTMDIRYFDAGWNEVTIAEKPGRYGALVTIRTPDGITDVRRVTLFKTPKPYNERISPYGVHLDFPKEFGLPGGIGKKDATPLEDTANWSLTNPDAPQALIAAGLHDVAADPAHNLGFNLWSIDEEWWAELDRKLGRHEIYKYRAFLPEGYEDNPDKSWPLVICLHGSGERGSDLKNVTVHGLPKRIANGAKFPFIVVAPLCPLRENWRTSTLMETLDEITSKYRVDAKRIYLTGLSMGGYGTWEAAARHPEKFAAVAPICGGAAPELAPRLAKVPIWAFHGGADPVVGIYREQRIVDALKKLKAPIKFTVYPGVQHDSWTQTYDDPALYEWLLQHSR